MMLLHLVTAKLPRVSGFPPSFGQVVLLSYLGFCINVRMNILYIQKPRNWSTPAFSGWGATGMRKKQLL